METRGTAGEWVKPTRLVAAFGADNLSAATRLVTEIERSSDLAAWKLDTTLTDLNREVERMADVSQQTNFRKLVERLKAGL